MDEERFVGDAEIWGVNDPDSGVDAGNEQKREERRRM